MNPIMTATLMMSFSSFFPMIYVRNPVKKAPAPNAIIARSNTIHKAKAKTLLMFVWFRPNPRQKSADTPPQASKANQGSVHKKKDGVEHLFVPSGINTESI